MLRLSANQCNRYNLNYLQGKISVEGGKLQKLRHQFLTLTEVIGPLCFGSRTTDAYNFTEITNMPPRLHILRFSRNRNVISDFLLLFSTSVSSCYGRIYAFCIIGQLNKTTHLIEPTYNKTKKHRGTRTKKS